MDVDAVVLDIDGVLVDVEDSYRRAIVESVAYVYGTSIDREAVQAFKNAGGFNNDWELTDAVALFVLGQQRGLGMGVSTYTDRIALEGGGLDAAKGAVRESLSAEDADAVLAEWDPDRLRDVFQQLYLGADIYPKLEGGESEIDQSGFIRDEPLLIEPATVEWLREHYPVGILTGRPGPEATIALKRADLELDDAFVMTMDDWDGTKPDPDALVTLAERLETDAVAYVGDQLDDVRTVVAANEADPDRAYRAVGVLTGGVSGEEGRMNYEMEGTDAVLDSVNDLPELLGEA